MRWLSPRWSLLVGLCGLQSVHELQYVEAQIQVHARPLSFGPRAWVVASAEHGYPGLRALSLATVGAVLTPPAVFVGLPVDVQMHGDGRVQQKIIYMPGVPTFAKLEKVADCAAQYWPVVLVQHGVRSADGTRVKVLEGKVGGEKRKVKVDGTYQGTDAKGEGRKSKRNLVVLYFQGNASSLPPCLPYFSGVLKVLHISSTNTEIVSHRHAVLTRYIRSTKNIRELEV